MRRYIGIDVHTESCTLVVLGPTGKRLQEARVETNGEALINFIKSIAGQKHVCFEEGTHAEWLYELLEPLVAELVVTIPAATRGSKSDTRDAWQRADELRRGSIERSVFKAPKRLTALRAAVKTYVALQRDVVRTKTRLNNLYRSRAVHNTGSAIYNPEQRGLWLRQLPAAYQPRGELLSLQLDGLISAYERAQHWLIEESQKVPIVQLLQTAPGIGEIRAAQIAAIVISPHRFRTRRQFWSYCGLGIVTRSSADWVSDRDGGWERRRTPQTRGLNRNRQPLLKNVFKGAAQTVIQNMPGHPLKQAYDRTTAAGTKPNLAQLTLARRIAGAVLAMWKNKERYDVTKQQR